MKNIIVFTVLTLMLTAATTLLAAEAMPLVYAGDDGELVYTPDMHGNRIPDFSRCGYMGGGVRIPTPPVVRKLAPGKGKADDTGRIQAAIDEVAARVPNKDGFRGVLLLKRGRYQVEGTLYIRSSGVVLRGEGQGENGTVLVGSGVTRRTLIVVGGETQIHEVEGSRRKVKDRYVPVGAMSLNVESTEGLSVGDAVVIYRPSTAEWIHAIKMDQIPGRKGRVTKQWKAGRYDLRFERSITAISKNQITLDAPIVNAMEDKYGGGSVYRYTEKGRISQWGVEHMRLVSEYEKGRENEDDAHAWRGVSLDHAENGWVRNLSIVHFSHAVTLGRMAKFVTVQDCAYIKPVSTIAGGKRYPYSIHGQYCLVQRCYSDHARHAQAAGARVCGPNVFLDCLAENTHADTGPHHRWAVGILWDNLKGGNFNAQDRAWMGSGHGWAGAQQVFWNCETSSICVQQPPTAQNYAIGCTGKIREGQFKGRNPGYYESHGVHVEPRSLYLQQLEQRLGPDAVKNVTTKAQRRGAIYSILKEQYSSQNTR